LTGIKAVIIEDGNLIIKIGSGDFVEHSRLRGGEVIDAWLPGEGVSGISRLGH
jgi:hypothetical protein